MTLDNLTHPEKENLPRRDFLESILKTTAGIMAVSGVVSGVGLVYYVLKNTSFSFELNTHPVDQVFRDNNGYRVFYTDNNQKVVERSYQGNLIIRKSEVPKEFREHFREITPGRAQIFKDLDEGARGYVNILNRIEQIKPIKSNSEYIYYVEIHLPKSSKISPGKELIKTGGIPNETVEKPMHEVK